MKSLRHLIFLFLLTQTAYGQTAKVAAWNWGGFYPLSQSKVKYFAEGIADMNADVVVLSEVNPDSYIQKVIKTLQDDYNLEYKAAYRTQDANQNIMILYKVGVQVSKQMLVPKSDLGNRGLRKALVANVRIGEFDFYIMGLHLKAGNAVYTRIKQVNILEDYYEELLKNAEKDILIIGDYNMRPKRDWKVFEAFNDNNYLRFISNEELAGQVSHIPQKYPQHKGSLLDGYAISKNHTSEYIEGSLEIFDIQNALNLSTLEYKNKVTDHLPLIATFRTDKDDD